MPSIGPEVGFEETNMISSKPVSGPRDEGPKGSPFSSELPTMRELSRFVSIKIPR